MNLNKVFLLGRLTRDPELRVTPSGKTVVNIGLATNSLRMDPDGNRKMLAEFHHIVLFGRLGEVASQYLKKGSLCLIVGRLQTRSWQGQDGVTHKRTEIVAEELQLGPRTVGESEERPLVSSETQEEVEDTISSEKQENQNDDSNDEINVEDIPF